MSRSERGETIEANLRAYREALPEEQRAIMEPPVFERAEDARRHRQERLAGACRLFARLGLCEGVAGHITARDPERPDRFWVNPLAVDFSLMRVSDLLLVDHEGRVLEGRRPVNPAAFAIHSRIHAARPEVVAVAHSHSVYGKAWSALARPLDPITQDACAFYGDHIVFDDYQGPAVTVAEGDELARALGTAKAAILRNHGLLTVGETVEACAWWYIAMERSCQAQLLAEAAGTPQVMPHDVARATFDIQGTPGIGWFNFQPLWDRISAEAPDLFE